jgi:hypothetical protein
MWQARDVCEVAWLTFKLWTFYGLSAYTVEGSVRSENRRIRNKKSYAFVLPLSLLIFNIGTYLKYVQVRVDIYSLTSLIQVASIYLINAVLIYYSLTKKTEFQSIFARFIFIEKLLLQFTKRKFRSAKIGRFLNSYIILKYLVTFLVSFSSLFYIGLSSKSCTFVACYYFGIIFNYNFEFLLFFCLLVLNEMYNILNDTIKTNMTQFKNIRKMYLLFHELSVSIHETFQKLVLLKILNDFIITITTIFYFLHAVVQFGLAPVISPQLFVSGLWLFQILSSNFAMVCLFGNIAKQVPKQIRILEIYNLRNF